MWPVNLNRRAVIAIATLAIACIASNPEVAAAIPLLEMVGIDVFAYLLASRLGPVLLQGVAPVIRDAYMRRGHRRVRPLGHAVNCRLGGYLRQVSWYTGQLGLAAAVGCTRICALRRQATAVPA